MSLTFKPSPEAYLRGLQQGDSTRGKLKIYLGYCAGVGKTFAMLANARVLRDEGHDVVVGLVETHGRQGTRDMLAGLEMIRRKSISYRQRDLEEFDLDAALTRKPEILLVDELAHSNIGDGRHPKRWGDIEELLAAGINVHTTLNVQHLESVSDVVLGITGVQVAEQVPDRFLEQADEIALIDLPADELLERLTAGKVYGHDQAKHATDGFFRKTNLLALRELAMRKAARHIDENARDYLKQQSLSGPWAAGERLLCCVGPSPYSEKVVRATKRLADAMGATWVALHVETGEVTAAENERVDHHLQLAQRLGAEVLTKTGPSLVDVIVETTAEKNVTKIVTGQTTHRARLRKFWRPSLIESVLQQTQGVDMLVLGSEAAVTSFPSASRPKASKRGKYFKAMLLVLLATGLGLPLSGVLSDANQVMLYLAAVVTTAYLYGRGPSNLASLLSVAAFNFCFVPPLWTLQMADPENVVTFLGLLLTGLFVSRLTASAKEQSWAARLREADALILLGLSRDLARAGDSEALVEAGQRHLLKAFGANIVLLNGPDGLTSQELDPRELAIADMALREGQPAGRGTGTLPAAGYQWHPLGSAECRCAVVGLERPVALGVGRRADLLEAVLNQLAAAFERLSLTRALSHNTGDFGTEGVVS